MLRIFKRMMVAGLLLIFVAGCSGGSMQHDRSVEQRQNAEKAQKELSRETSY